MPQQDTGMPPADAAPAANLAPVESGIQALATAIVTALIGNEDESVHDALVRLLPSPLPVTVNNPSSLTIPNPLPISGTVALSGPVEIANDAGSAIPVSGTVGISGDVAVTGPLTNTQLRATPLAVEIANDTGAAINVSGPVTNTELRAVPLPVASTPTRGSLTQTTGTTTAASKQAASVNASRVYLQLHNPGTVDLYFGFGTAAVVGAGVLLRPGGFETFENSFVHTGTVTVIASDATAGRAYTILEA